MNNSKLQTLSAHFNELKNRIVFCTIFFILIFGACYYFSDKIYEFLLRPLAESSLQKDHRIIYTSPSEAFFTYLRLSFNSALFFSLPIFAAQFYLFLAPALYKKEKKFILSILISVPILFLFGALIAYFFILPIAFDFFLSFETVNPNGMAIQLEARISEYLNLVSYLLFGFGIAFEMPLLLILLIKANLLSTDSLRKTRKYWIICIFIISAILTPPDVLSQLFMALLLILLFEMVLLVCDGFLVKTNVAKKNVSKKK